MDGADVIQSALPVTASVNTSCQLTGISSKTVLPIVRSAVCTRSGSSVGPPPVSTCNSDSCGQGPYTIEPPSLTVTYPSCSGRRADITPDTAARTPAVATGDAG